MLNITPLEKGQAYLLFDILDRNSGGNLRNLDTPENIIKVMDSAHLDDPKYMQRYSDNAKGDNTLERDKLPDKPAPLTLDQIAVIQHQIKSRGITFLKGLSHFIITDCAEPEIWQGFVDDYAKSLEPPDTVFRFPAHEL